MRCWHGWWVASSRCLAHNVCETRRMHPEAGGLYCFIRDGFGRLPAFLYGWRLFLVIASGTIAALAHAFTRYLREIIPLSDEAAAVVVDRHDRRRHRSHVLGHAQELRSAELDDAGESGPGGAPQRDIAVARASRSGPAAVTRRHAARLRSLLQFWTRHDPGCCGPTEGWQFLAPTAPAK